TPGGPYASVQAGITGTSYPDLGVVNGTRYYYVVSAVNAGGQSGDSLEAAATPTGIPAPPANLVAIARNAQVLLSWNASVQAVSYTLKRGSTSGGPYSVLIAGTTLTAFSDGSVSNGTTYYYVVTATNAS